MNNHNKELQLKAVLLNELAKTISSCLLCGLCNTRTNAVPGEGSSNAKIMFLGEAPGRNEDITARPFCGAAGKNLDLGLQTAGLKREEVFITSVVKCRPPKNRNPKPDELESCKPYLENQIEIINPKIIVLMGNFGLKHFFPQKKITESRGVLIEHNHRFYYPILHPAAIIYKRSNMDIYISDFKKLREIIDTKFK